MLDRRVPLRGVQHICGDKSKAAIYAAVKRGEFPQPIEPGLWSEADLKAHQEALVKKREANFAARSRARRARLMKEAEIA
jgi:predicted DNA-binding transcriptional regulator AlpA